MVVFGTYTLPHVLTVQTQKGNVLQDLVIPGRPYGYRKNIAGIGVIITLTGEIRPDTGGNQLAKDQIAALADGNARILDLQTADLTVLMKCFRWATGPTWTDNTVESQTGSGTPFSLLAASTDYSYFGHQDRFNELYFYLQTLGTYGALTWQYSQGSGAWGTLTVTDGTSGLHQNGAVTFTPPSDWKLDTVNSIPNMFWGRVSAASVTTAATVNQIQMNRVWNCIMQNPLFNETADNPREIPYTLVFDQVENP